MALPPSLLEFSGIGVAPYATRGATQSLTPIGQATQNKRTVNGALVDLALEQFQKFSSTIECTDQQAPAVDGVWPGKLITVKCAHELAYLTVGGTPSRTVVTDSERIEGDFTYYRPELVMRVSSYSSQFDEWNASVQWSMTLEEV